MVDETHRKGVGNGSKYCDNTIGLVFIVTLIRKRSTTLHSSNSALNQGSDVFKEMATFRRAMVHADGPYNIRNKLVILRGGAVSPSDKPKAGGLSLVGCPRLLIQYIPGYPPNLEVASSILNPRMRRAVVARLPITH
jgi:hypothetical protein